MGFWFWSCRFRQSFGKPRSWCLSCLLMQPYCVDGVKDKEILDDCWLLHFLYVEGRILLYVAKVVLQSVATSSLIPEQHVP